MRASSASAYLYMWACGDWSDLSRRAQRPGPEATLDLAFCCGVRNALSCLSRKSRDRMVLRLGVEHTGHEQIL